MCGVIACRTSEPAIDYLIAALRRLEYRGYDSVGVAVRTVAGDIATVRTVGRIGALDKRVREWAGPAFGSVGIGHTRWATHGTVTESNAHPHVDCTGRICVVHNGIIENADQLRRALRTSGHLFTSSVDSEVICHLVEEQLQFGGNLLDAVEDALAAVEGSWALAVLEQTTGQLVVAANHSPLLVAHTVLGDFATSDIAAIADWTDRFRVLEDGDVVDLSGSGRWRNRGVDVAPQALTPCLMRGNDVELAGYSDYMAKEIDEQPQAVARVLDELGGGIADGKLWSDLGLMPFDRLQVIGCGTSLNAGTVVGNFLRTVGGLPVMTTVGSESDGALLEPHTLTVAFSQSGETADVLNALASRGISQPPVLAITNSAHSTLARRAEAVVTCAAGPEIGVAATKTFVCQIVAGVAVMISALVARRRLSESAAGQLVDALRRLPDQLDTACTTAKCVVPSLIDGLMTASGFIFIARGAGLPYAAEGALKLKELTYQWAEHYPAGELKHGPLALVGTSTPVVVIENADRKLAGNVSEVMARGGQIISIGGPGSTLPVVDDLMSLWGPLAAAVPLQILARQLALALGRDVDKPRNLAKSVTVE
ncbi:glutamine--fructose-6-phosphate transaminase (isomerizing) [Mycobacterium sp. CBMA293]|uniref:glutamine--fructose-6-phosphate transaminase (isomerizing) n=1 Tax=unclassified Mycolicibacterium TaxID=2636767 RepID=UPI0012DD781B|nr:MULTISPECIES: glutamine--fructose-6-phosphate transaminase (isomerizing) [unclassified Mycolicibacterium]MUL46245.1 glutamine--fructose-6-phosphate transaminase (isomerizing) [Mycolicibacterium sp. CBMA 360]MUL58704.1 glutamine--fructose-6-phosphate transaminase (isomerizing) [Mycolicibacterium sp. CBMA 335]MUL69098.1 glutamine--fructose-6-phosphate transaminase (isomerizing) [Mycolicibacterium sp. CBMA 311]MUL94062.1 glutamine--fructose-6-phosphate transaminase (isomerizing) [Mycolicibacter